MKKHKIAILASGNGTNAQRIAEYFADSKNVEISLILSNKADAYVLQRAENLGIASGVFTGKELRDPSGVLKILQAADIDFIVLAGFLLLVPDFIVDAYPNKIVNIHPALLPKFGGKGFYGEKVHEAVIAAGEKQSGITIHYVNNNFDDGNIIFQALCPVDPTDTPETLANKIHALEHKYFPEIIDDILN